MKRLAFVFTSVISFSFLTFSCYKEEEPCVENIKSNCTCYEIYAPVCGCNGKTYDNDCFAECAGITDFTQGACE